MEADEAELKLATIGQDGSDLLIETPTLSVAGLDHMLYRLRAHGYRIILAHPERSPQFQRDLGPLRELVDQGVLLQVNADSLLARSRTSGPAALAERLCREGLAHVLAGDAHRGSEWRPVTQLGEAVELAGALIGAERARWLARETPAGILAGEPLGDPPPISSGSRRPRRRLFRRR